MHPIERHTSVSKLLQFGDSSYIRTRLSVRKDVDTISTATPVGLRVQKGRMTRSEFVGLRTHQAHRFWDESTQISCGLCMQNGVVYLASWVDHSSTKSPPSAGFLLYCAAGEMAQTSFATFLRGGSSRACLFSFAFGECSRWASSGCGEIYLVS